MPVKDDVLTLSVARAAQMLGVDRRTYMKAAQAGELPLIRCANRMVVPRAAFMRLLGEGGEQVDGGDVIHCEE